MRGATGDTSTAGVDQRRRYSALSAVAAFCLVRVAGLVVLALAAEWRGVGLAALLTRWDGQWYAGIARDGYGHVHEHPDGRLLADYVFFPALPAAERLVHGVIGVDHAAAGLLISAVAAPMAAWGVFRVTERVSDARTAWTLVVLWASLPMSVVQTLAYTEALFTAFAAWALHHALRERWCPAGGLAVAAALTRPTGVAVTAAVGAAAVVAWRSGRRSRAIVPTVAVCLAGSVAYPAWVGWRLGSPAGYFEVTEAWGNSFDGGLTFATWVGSLLTSPGTLLAGVAVTAGLCGLVALVRAVWRDDLVPAPAVVYALVLVVIAIGMSGYFGSKPRYLLPAFVLLLPVARWIDNAGSTRRSVAVLGAFAATSVAYGSVWLLGDGPP